MIGTLFINFLKHLITSLMTRYRDTGDVKYRAKNGCHRNKPTETDNRISGMAARRRFVTANGIRANVLLRSRRSMKLPQRTDRHELAIGHLRDQLCRAVCVRLIPSHNFGHLRQFLREELARIPQQSITTLVGSMRKRLDAECIASRGVPTFLAFLPSAHPHQYNQCYDCKTAICYEERNRKAIFTQGKLHNSDSTSWYS